MKLKILITFIFLILNTADAISGTISFTNGLWTQSFDCAEWSADWPVTLDCNGMDTAALNTCAGVGVVPCQWDNDSMGEQILASANNPNGVAGTNAQVHYFYTGIDGKGSVNDVSGGLKIYFPSNLPEYWFRFYIYFPTEMGWGGTFSGWKTLYCDTEGHNTYGWYFGFPRGSDSTGAYLQQSATALASSGYGDNWLESDSRQGFGRWIPVEYHAKMDTNGTDGIFQAWVDETLIIDRADVNWAYNEGFHDIGVGSNGDAAVGPPNSCVGIRFDDFAIATTAYNGFVDDGHGNPRIGLLNIVTGFRVDITSPTSENNYTSSLNKINISGSASDKSTIESVTWSNDRGGSGSASGTTSWVINNITLLPGQNIITVAAHNDTGETLTDTLIVTYASSITDTAPQKIILEDGFEANNVINWDDDFIRGDTHIDTSPVYQGTYALKMESSDPGNYAHFFGDHPGVDGEMVTDVTVIEHYRPSENFDWVTGLKLWIMNCYESWGAGYYLAAGQSKPHTWAPFYMTISVNGNGEPYGQLTRADGLGGPGTLWQNFWQNVDQPAAFSKGQWNKLRFRLKLNSLGANDGIFQLWVDDKLKCNYSDVNFRGTYSQYGWNHLMMSMHANPAPTQSQWVSRDDIQIISDALLPPDKPEVR